MPIKKETKSSCDIFNSSQRAKLLTHPGKLMNVYKQHI